MRTAICPGPLRAAKLEERVERDEHHACAGVGARRVCVRMAGVADLPTRHGRRCGHHLDAT